MAEVVFVIRKRFPSRETTARQRSWTIALECIRVEFARSNPYHLIQRRDENLAVADLAGARGMADRFHRAFDQVVGQRDLQFHLGQEIHHVFRTAIKFRVALLAPEALDLGDGDAVHPDIGQRLAHVVQLEWLDDGGDQFHDADLSGEERKNAAVEAAVVKSHGTEAHSGVSCPSAIVFLESPDVQRSGTIAKNKPSWTIAQPCRTIPTTQHDVHRLARHEPLRNLWTHRGNDMIDVHSIDQLAHRLATLVPPGLAQARDDMEANFRDVLEHGLRRLDLVTREEFDAQRAVLERAREQVTQLEKRVTDLEATRKA